MASLFPAAKALTDNQVFEISSLEKDSMCLEEWTRGQYTPFRLLENIQ